MLQVPSGQDTRYIKVTFLTLSYPGTHNDPGTIGMNELPPLQIAPSGHLLQARFPQENEIGP